MRTYDFDLVLVAGAPPAAFDASAFLDAVEGPMFKAFEGDVTPAVIAGVPRLSCAVEAGTLEDAVRRVAGEAAALGYSVKRIEIDPEALELPVAA